MGLVQLVYPNLDQEAGVGWCLKLVQDAFGAPVMHASATDAANATTRRYPDRNMPNVAVPVWFDHWGTYQGRYANWGHVVVWVPSRGFLSSPLSGFGQKWFPTLESVEIAFNAKFRFYSEDINALFVVTPAPTPKPLPTRKGSKMFLCKFAHAAGPDQIRYAFFGPKFWFELSTPEAVETFKAQLGIQKDNVAAYAFDCGNESNWVRFQSVTGLSPDEIIHV